MSSVKTTEYIVVSVTFPNISEAESCMQDLLAKHFAACCQVFPLQSVYWWKGQVEKAEEVCVFIKSRKDFFGKIKDCILSKHSYEVPEILAYPVLDGHRAYLHWIDDETKLSAEHD